MAKAKGNKLVRSKH